MLVRSGLPSWQLVLQGRRAVRKGVGHLACPGADQECPVLPYCYQPASQDACSRCLGTKTREWPFAQGTHVTCAGGNTRWSPRDRAQRWGPGPLRPHLASPHILHTHLHSVGRPVPHAVIFAHETTVKVHAQLEYTCIHAYGRCLLHAVAPSPRWRSPSQDRTGFPSPTSHAPGAYPRAMHKVIDTDEAAVRLGNGTPPPGCPPS